MWRAQRGTGFSATTSLPLPVRRRLALAGLITATVVLATAVGLPATAALFTAEYPITAGIGAGQVFPGDRDTPAFTVTDVSSGSAVDASSPVAYASDGLTFPTSAWSTGFASDRYVEFALNGPLPAGLGMSSASVSFRWASATGGATACYFIEIRRELTGTVVDTLGSGFSPLGCVTGTSPAGTTTAVSGVGTTDVANDLRIRVYGADSAAAGALVDAATVTGNYGLASFTLYPIEVRDSADTTPSIVRWGLAGP